MGKNKREKKTSANDDGRVNNGFTQTRPTLLQSTPHKVYIRDTCPIANVPNEIVHAYCGIIPRDILLLAVKSTNIFYFFFVYKVSWSLLLMVK